MKQPLFSTSYAPRDGESTLYEIEHRKTIEMVKYLVFVRLINRKSADMFDIEFDLLPPVGAKITFSSEDRTTVAIVQEVETYVQIPKQRNVGIEKGKVTGGKVICDEVEVEV